MEAHEAHSQAVVERTMKVQEVIMRAMARKITWYEAAEIIGLSCRQMRRWEERWGAPSPKRVQWRRSLQHERTVALITRSAMALGGLQIEKTKWRFSLAGCKVKIYGRLDQTLIRRSSFRLSTSNLTEPQAWRHS